LLLHTLTGHYKKYKAFVERLQAPRRKTTDAM